MVTAETFERYAALRVPRYTSYPTAPQFGPDIGESDYREWLASLDPRRLKAGSSEIRNWIAVGAAAAGTNLKVTWSAYVPGYRTLTLTGTGLGFAAWE